MSRKGGVASRCMALCWVSVRGGGGGPRWPRWRLVSFLLRFVAVQVFEGFEFLDEGFVLVLQHGHTVLQTLDVLLLLPATLPGRLPVGHEDRVWVDVHGYRASQGLAASTKLEPLPSRLILWLYEMVITKDGSNAQKNFPTGNQYSIIIIVFLVLSC